MDKKDAIVELGRVGDRLHLDRVPGASNIYWSIRHKIFDTDDNSTGIDEWLNSEKNSVKRLSMDGDVLCVPPKYYNKWYDGTTKASHINYYSDYISEGDTVIDVGGHVGSTMLRLRQLVGNSGKVVVFEPMLPWVNYINKTIDENGFDNVIIENKVVSDTVGDVQINIPSKETSQASISKRTDGKNINVSSTTLPKYIDSRDINEIDFAKIDVEGGEYEIIYNSDIVTVTNRMDIELHPHKIGDEKTSKLFNKLTKTGKVLNLHGKQVTLEDIPKNEPSHIHWERSDL